MSPQPTKKPDEPEKDAPTNAADEPVTVTDPAKNVEPGVVPTDEQQAQAAEGVADDAVTGENVAAKPAFAHDPLDAGVPQSPGKPHAGPDDAFNPVDTEGKTGGEARADYSGRLGGTTVHHTSEVIPEAERVPGGPTTRLVPQVPAS